MTTRLGLAALKRAFLHCENRKPTPLEEAEKEGAMRTQRDTQGWEWTIPQQLIDEGVTTDMALAEAYPICIRTGFWIALDADKKTIGFEFHRPHLRLVV